MKQPPTLRLPVPSEKPRPLCNSRGRLLIVLAATFTYMSAGSVAHAKDLNCPPPPAQTATNVSVDTRAEIGKLGKLSAGELANQTRVVAQPLFDKVPNQDRFYLAQSMLSLFCQMMRTTSLPDEQKLDRLQTFNQQIMEFIANTSLPSPVKKENGKHAGSASVRVAAIDPALEKYVDLTVHKSIDKKGRNIAFRVLRYEGVDVEPLESAAREVLLDRGFNVMPLFKPNFTKDEIARTLFTGSESLAKRLRLSERCDTVLLAKLKLAGPVSNAGGGLYITHWILSIHAISPESGDVTSQREIEAKGAGSSPEASQARAVRELEESIEETLKLWSWT